MRTVFLITMDCRLVVLLIISVLLVSLFYFQCFCVFSGKFGDEDRECIRNEWQESSLIDPTQDYGSTYRISFADTQHYFKWLHLPKINSPGPEILIIIASRSDNFSRRNILRKTWMNLENRKIRTLFLVGLGSEIDEKMKKIVMKEAKLYGDMVVTDLEDTYIGLPFKTLSILLYSISKSPSTHLIGKIDEDVIFFPNQLLSLIDNGSINMNSSSIYGQIVEAGAPVKSECVTLRAPKTSYNCQKYPSYLSGPFYLATRKAAEKILKDSKHRRFLLSEDILITGLLANDVGVEKHQLPLINMYPEVKIGEEEPILAWHTKMSNDQYLDFYRFHSHRNLNF